MENKLLAKANSVPFGVVNKIRPDQDSAELAVAWLSGEISSKQLAYALDRKEGNILGKLPPLLKYAYTLGLIKKAQ